jgi:nitrogen-specific signal transduction histidine kinase
VGLAEGMTPPWEALRSRLEAEAVALAEAGNEAGAAALRAVVDQWWTEQQAWNARALDLLGVHHEINNALVGVRGNAQLLLMNPAAQQAGLRERLEVVLRESSRIQEAARRLAELKTGLGGGAAGQRAA